MAYQAPIYLEPNMVPASLRGTYQGKKFKAIVCTEMTIPSDAGLWSGGTRDTYRVVAMEMDNPASFAPVNHQAAPWDRSRKDETVTLRPGIAVVCHSIFCGKDMGLTFYVHPDNAAKLLPAPKAELTEFEKIVLQATCSYKSSYGGMDRYEMARRDARNGNPFPTRDEWAFAKNSLITMGLLNKVGAVTPAGRNARPSRY